VCVVVLQTGAPPAQLPFATQATQVPAVVSQAGVEPVHLAALVAEQVPQAPDGSQAGVAPPHSPSPAHPRQACVVVLQTGVEPEQSAFATQPTQPPVATLHTDVVPVHFVTFVAEQEPHDPEG
jgi:hypothetical protein